MQWDKSRRKRELFDWMTNAIAQLPEDCSEELRDRIYENLSQVVTHS